MNNFEAVKILDPLRDLLNDLAGPCLAMGDSKLSYVVEKAMPSHVLCHYFETVLVLRAVDKPQGISAFVFSDLLQQLDFLWSFTTLTVHLFEIMFVNQLDGNFVTSCLVLR